MATNGFTQYDKNQRQAQRRNECIVVIDDSPSMLATLTHPLEEAGYSVYTAEDGPKGLAEVRKRRPNVVVLDLLIPHMSGYEVLDRIKDDPSLAGTGTIVITGMVDDRRECVEIAPRADVCLAKPIDLDELLLSVEEILQAQAASSGLRGRLQSGHTRRI